MGEDAQGRAVGRGRRAGGGDGAPAGPVLRWVRSPGSLVAMGVAAGVGCALLTVALVLSWGRGAPVDHRYLGGGTPWWHAWIDLPPALGLVLVLAGAVLGARVAGRGERVRFVLGRQWRTVDRARVSVPASGAERAGVRSAAQALSDNRCSLLLLGGAVLEMGGAALHPVDAWFTAVALPLLLGAVVLGVLTFEGARRAARVLRQLDDDHGAPRSA